MKKDWVIDHIWKNPSIPFGTLYRDYCFWNIDRGSGNSLFVIIAELEKDKIIISDHNNYNTFYTIRLQKIRNDKLLQLGIG